MTELQITYISAEPQLKNNGNFHFCKKLNQFLSNLKICHLFTDNYNLHKIFGNLYDDLSDLFDKLEEEVIGLTKLDTQNFPDESFFNAFCQIDIIENDGDYKNSFFSIKNDILNLLDSQEFRSFVTSKTKSGLNNTLEEIFSAINKSEYLIGLVK